MTVTNVDTNVVRTADTDEKGRYLFAALPPGRYRLKVALLGFAEQASEDIVLQLGHSVEKDFRLRLMGTAETISVVANPASLDARRVAVAFSVGEEQIDGLPINGRNFVNFAALTPGVTTDRTTTRGIIATSGLSFTGQPARANGLTVDGFDNNDVTTGGVRGLSYEKSDVKASNFVNIDPAAANVLRGAGFPVELGYVPYRVDSSQALAKIDHQWTASDTLTLRGNVSRVTNENAEAFGGLVARSRGGALDAKDWFVSAAQIDILSPRWVSETRVLVSRQDQTIESLDPRCG